MKRGLILLLAFVIMSSIAYAANSYNLDDFSKQPIQGIVVGEGDEVRFNLFNATHSIIFDRVRDIGFRFTGHAYLKDQYQMTGFATKDFTSHLDINRDNVSDIDIAFYKSVYDAAANKTYATAIFKLENVPTANAVAPTGKEGVVSKSQNNYLLPVSITVFILVLVLIARKSSKKKKVQKQEA